MAAIQLRHRAYDRSASYLLGILNLTPDSFSDGGNLPTMEAAIAHGHALIEAGAAVLDIGGESTRPGATPVTAEVECERVLPVVRALAREYDVSIDTYHAATAEAAIAAGAALVNDISGGLLDHAMLPTVARLGCTIILGHLRGTPATMNEHARYEDVIAEVVKELDDRIRAAESAGIERSRILIDPGLGFAKRAEHNWQLLSARAGEALRALGVPIVVGASRKRFLVEALGDTSLAARDRATAAVTSVATSASYGAMFVRVHDPASQHEALVVGRSLRGQARGQARGESELA